MGLPCFLAPLLAFSIVTAAAAEDLILTIPPARMSVNVQNQAVAITVSGSISGAAAAHNPATFRLALTADLSDLQQNISTLLSSQLNRSEKCGERLTIDRAELAPGAPSAVLTAYLHYEKWACAKVFGKDVAKRLVGGNGVVDVRLTPAVEDTRSIRMQSEVGSIQADGSLGEVLRSGSLGATLREKIKTTLAAAMDKAGLGASVPAELQPVAAIQTARFADCAGRLCLDLTGDVRISGDQLRSLIDERKAVAASR